MYSPPPVGRTAGDDACARVDGQPLGAAIAQAEGKRVIGRIAEHAGRQCKREGLFAHRLMIEVIDQGFGRIVGERQPIQPALADGAIGEHEFVDALAENDARIAFLPVSADGDPVRWIRTHLDHQIQPDLRPGDVVRIDAGSEDHTVAGRDAIALGLDGVLAITARVMEVIVAGAALQGVVAGAAIQVGAPASGLQKVVSFLAVQVVAAGGVGRVELALTAHQGVVAAATAQFIAEAVADQSVVAGIATQVGIEGAFVVTAAEVQVQAEVVAQREVLDVGVVGHVEPLGRAAHFVDVIDDHGVDAFPGILHHHILGGDDVGVITEPAIQVIDHIGRAADQDVVAAVAPAGECVGAPQFKPLDVGVVCQRVGQRSADGIERCADTGVGLHDDIAQAVDDVDLIGNAADQGVVASATVQQVQALVVVAVPGCRPDLDGVVQVVADELARDVDAPPVVLGVLPVQEGGGVDAHQVLDVGGKGVGVGLRIHGVNALARQFDHRIRAGRILVTGTDVITVVARAAAQHVVLSGAGDRVVPIQLIVTVATIDLIDAAVAVQRIVAGAAEDPIIARAAEDTVVAGQSVQLIVAEPALHIVVGGGAKVEVITVGADPCIGIAPEILRRQPGAIGELDAMRAVGCREESFKVDAGEVGALPEGDHQVVSGDLEVVDHVPGDRRAKLDHVAARVRLAQVEDRVVAIVEVEDVGVVAGATVEYVAAEPAAEGVVAGTAVQEVVAGQAMNDIIAAAAVQVVCVLRADHLVVARAAHAGRRGDGQQLLEVGAIKDRAIGQLHRCGHPCRKESAHDDGVDTAGVKDDQIQAMGPIGQVFGSDAAAEADGVLACACIFQNHQVGAEAGLEMETVVACTAAQKIVACTAGQNIVAVAAGQVIVAVSALHIIVACVAVEHVIAGTAKDQIIAFGGRDDVIAIFTVQFVVADAAVDAVIAGSTEDQVAAVVAVDGVVAGAAIDRVVTGFAVQGVVAITPIQDIVADAAAQLVDACATAQAVIARAAIQLIVAVIAAQYVVTVLAEQAIVVVSTGQRVLAVAALQLILAVAALQRVVAILAGQEIVAGAAIEEVIAAVALQLVVARFAVQGVVAVEVCADIAEGAVAEQNVVAITAPDHVVAAQADHGVGTYACIDRVVSMKRSIDADGIANDHVIAAAAAQGVVAAVTVDLVVAVAAINEVVPGHAADVVGVSQPIVDTVALEDVIAFTAVDDVVASLPVDAVISRSADQGVVARGIGMAGNLRRHEIPHAAGGSEVIAQDEIVVLLAADVVVVGATDQQIVTGAATDVVIAFATVGDIRAVPGVDLIVATRAHVRIGFDPGILPVVVGSADLEADQVLCRVTVDRRVTLHVGVPALAEIEDIVAFAHVLVPAFQIVRHGPCQQHWNAEQHIVSQSAEKTVAARPAKDQVVAVATVDPVVAIAAVHAIIAAHRADDVVAAAYFIRIAIVADLVVLVGQRVRILGRSRLAEAWQRNVQLAVGPVAYDDAAAGLAMGDDERGGIAAADHLQAELAVLGFPAKAVAGDVIDREIADGDVVEGDLADAIGIDHDVLRSAGKIGQMELVGVEAGAAFQPVGSLAALQNVIAGTAVEHVVAFIALQQIVAGAAAQAVHALGTVQAVIATSADQDTAVALQILRAELVIAGGAEAEVVAHGGQVAAAAVLDLEDDGIVGIVAKVFRLLGEFEEVLDQVVGHVAADDTGHRADHRDAGNDRPGDHARRDHRAGQYTGYDGIDGAACKDGGRRAEVTVEHLLDDVEAVQSLAHHAEDLFRATQRDELALLVQRADHTAGQILQGDGRLLVLVDQRQLTLRVGDHALAPRQQIGVSFQLEPAGVDAQQLGILFQHILVHGEQLVRRNCTGPVRWPHPIQPELQVGRKGR